jgi:hypothetical protein
LRNERFVIQNEFLELTHGQMNQNNGSHLLPDCTTTVERSSGFPSPFSDPIHGLLIRDESMTNILDDQEMEISYRQSMNWIPIDIPK